MELRNAINSPSRLQAYYYRSSRMLAFALSLRPSFTHELHGEGTHHQLRLLGRFSYPDKFNCEEISKKKHISAKTIEIKTTKILAIVEIYQFFLLTYESAQNIYLFTNRTTYFYLPINQAKYFYLPIK
jgi:hypothetical protein